ncbi:conserved hypothetical protein, partial [Ricinus communis]
AGARKRLGVGLARSADLRAMICQAQLAEQRELVPQRQGRRARRIERFRLQGRDQAGQFHVRGAMMDPAGFGAERRIELVSGQQLEGRGSVLRAVDICAGKFHALLLLGTADAQSGVPAVGMCKRREKAQGRARCDDQLEIHIVR